MNDQTGPATTVEPTLSAPVAEMAYSAEPAEPIDAAESAPWWHPVALATGILTVTGALAGAIYLSGQPVEHAATVAIAPETVTMIPPPPPTVAAPPSTTTPPATITVTAQPEPAPPPTARMAAPPQFAPTPAQDAHLINMLRNDGWAIWDPSIVIRQAHFSCKLFRQGETPEYVNTRLANESGMGIGPALMLTSSAMIVYPDCRRPS